MASNQGISYTLNSLKRWSCGENRDLPSVETIKDIHVYDFDNTLFKSPLPNRAIWNPLCVSRLMNMDVFVNGGWWHDANLLKATGEGVEVEEPRAWDGWWNERIVRLVQISMQQEDAVTVLLTGRAEGDFQDIIRRMCKSKGLVFDMICLKPFVGPNNETFNSTMGFKQIFLKTLIRTYAYATVFKLYEDRERHITQFREFADEINDEIISTRSREKLKAEVIPVLEQESTLDPLVEMRTIQSMINSHNQAILAGIAAPKFTPLIIQKTVLYTAYHISNIPEQKKLLTLLPQNTEKVKKLASSIIISPRNANQTALAKIGGLGTKISFRVTDTGSFDNRIWAARCEPTDPNQQIWHINGPRLSPMVVLAIKPGTHPSDVRHINKWQQVSQDKAYTFQTTVKEIFRLNIEDETDPNKALAQNGTTHRQQPPTRSTKDFPPLPPTKHHAPPNQNQNPPSFRGSRSGPRTDGGNRRDYQHSHRGGGGRENRNGRGGRGRGGNRGGQSGYRDYDAQGQRSWDNQNSGANGSGVFDAY